VTGFGSEYIRFFNSVKEILWDHKFLSGVTGWRKTQVSDCTGSNVYTCLISTQIFNKATEQRAITQGKMVPPQLKY
jgi:hypothetical protein